MKARERHPKVADKVFHRLSSWASVNANLLISMTEQLYGVVRVPLRCPVRSGAEIGLPSLRLSISQSASLGNFLFAPASPIEKDFLYLMS